MTTDHLYEKPRPWPNCAPRQGRIGEAIPSIASLAENSPDAITRGRAQTRLATLGIGRWQPTARDEVPLPTFRCRPSREWSVLGARNQEVAWALPSETSAVGTGCYW